MNAMLCSPGLGLVLEEEGMVDPSANHVRVNVFVIIMMRDDYVIMHYVISAFLYIYYYVLCVASHIIMFALL